jgi:hypothetical protein
LTSAAQAAAIYDSRFALAWAGARPHMGHIRIHFIS